MEHLKIKHTAHSRLSGKKEQAIIGVVASGNLEVLLERVLPDRHCEVDIATTVTADVLVDAMQADERIEDQQPRLERGDGLFEARAIGLEIEPQAGRGDHLHVEVG